VAIGAKVIEFLLALAMCAVLGAVTWAVVELERHLL
jgi:hypothetical protein